VSLRSAEYAAIAIAIAIATVMVGMKVRCQRDHHVALVCSVIRRVRGNV
jgi:hypothetical protein